MGSIRKSVGVEDFSPEEAVQTEEPVETTASPEADISSLLDKWAPQ